MSSVVISGDTSGAVTLQAPAVAGTTVLTLPATSGTVVTTATATGISGSAITTGTVATNVGGTGVTSFTSGGAVYATSISALTTGTLPVASGGTGATTLTANNVILGAGTSAVTFVAPSTTGNLLTSNGTTWTSAAAPSSTPTTAQVLSATAGATAGDVGTYAFLGRTNAAANATMIFGTNYAGSLFSPGGFTLAGNTGWNTSGGAQVASGGFGGSAQSGTWKAMGQYNDASFKTATVMLRIS